MTQNAQPTHPGGTVEPIEVRSLAELGAAIRRIRRARGWTQSELADWIGSNRFTVHRLERGGATGMPVVLRAIATLGYSAVLVPRKAPSSTEGDRVVREPRG